MSANPWKPAALVTTAALAVAVCVRGLTGTLAPPARADQDYMRSAREHVVTARDALMRSQQKTGGHRERAIELCTSAIEEIDRGMSHVLQ